MDSFEKSEIPADAKLPLKQGEFRIRVFHEEETGFDHVALTLGIWVALTLH